ncbi:hypothetical protein AVEN_118964-1, partial [Araneus ventricosus]
TLMGLEVSISNPGLLQNIIETHSEYPLIGNGTPCTRITRINGPGTSMGLEAAKFRSQIQDCSRISWKHIQRLLELEITLHVH